MFYSQNQLKLNIYRVLVDVRVLSLFNVMIRRKLI